MNILLSDINVPRLLLNGSAGLVIVAIHGFLLAFFARLLGDEGPSHDGRRTLNPFAHMDIFSLAGFAFVQLGWIRLMDISASDIRGGLVGIAAAVLLALLATWAIGQGLMASRLFLVTIVPQDFLMAAEAWLFTFTRLSERFALFNLLPLLSLSAGHLTQTWLPVTLFDRPLVLSGLTLILAVLVRIWFS